MNMRYFLAGGMFLSGVTTILFGYARYFNIHYFWYFVIVQVIPLVLSLSSMHMISFHVLKTFYDLCVWFFCLSLCFVFLYSIWTTLNKLFVLYIFKIQSLSALPIQYCYWLCVPYNYLYSIIIYDHKSKIYYRKSAFCKYVLLVVVFFLCIVAN